MSDLRYAARLKFRHYCKLYLMKLSDFHYNLPDKLIARYPAPERTASRLMVVKGDSGTVSHRQFTDLLEFLNKGDLLVFNDTRVLPARMWGRKESGGKIEVLVERVLDKHTLLAHMRASKPAKPGTRLLMQADSDSSNIMAQFEVLRRRDALFELKVLGDDDVMTVLNTIGHMPLPPYIDRADERADRERYQTVYSKEPGAVAAPTAGLHFSEDFIAACQSKGVDIAFVTLHVGAGTFQPVRVDNIIDHKMHAETVELSQSVCDQVRATRANGGRVVAVGTTSVRSLESASQSGEIKPFSGDSEIFIYPGYRFKSVDAILTNFHLPESTLIMLVSAFAGRDLVLDAYRQAVDEEYRFFSYGDAMLLLPETGAT